jgi:hypothetical protein
MFIVRKLDRELAAYPGLGKRKSPVVTRRNVGVADRTDDWTRAFEELRAMAADTRIVVRIISDIRKGARFLPVVGWNVVARSARVAVLCRSVREFRVVD